LHKRRGQFRYRLEDKPDVAIHVAIQVGMDIEEIEEIDCERAT
jgi:hypothetical protein